MPVIENQKALDALTTFRLRAEAEYYAEADSLESLEALLAEADSKGWPVYLLGGGANTVFMPKVPGLVIRMTMKGLRWREKVDSWELTAAAGEILDEVVRASLEKTGGLENLSLIPGTIGGAVVQNAGAYGSELAEYFVGCRVYDRDEKRVRKLTLEDCDFSYRMSVFKKSEKRGDRFVVLDATFRLPKAWRPVTGYKALADYLASRGIDEADLTPKVVSQAVRAVRHEKLPDPADIGNAGSFFKNPIVTDIKARDLLIHYPNIVAYDIGGARMKLAAGWLIENAGLKCAAAGGAGVYPKHALILVNNGNADGADVAALRDKIIEGVQKRYGVMLEPEPVFVGEI